MTAKRAPRARGNPKRSPWRDGGPEAARHTVQVHLRLPPEARAELRAVAARDHGGDVSATVAALAHEAMRRSEDSAPGMSQAAVHQAGAGAGAMVAADTPGGMPDLFVAGVK